MGLGEGSVHTHTTHNLVFLCHREEEEDKLIGAMLKKKGRRKESVVLR